MFNLTKLDLLWDWVGDLKKRIIPLEEKIPKDYSTTETATGQKWIDGKSIYRKVFTGDLPDATGTVVVGEIGIGSQIISYDSMIFKTITTYNAYNTVTIYFRNNTGEVTFDIGSTQYLLGTYVLYIYYTKPNPTPGRAPEEKKTTKKKTSK